MERPNKRKQTFGIFPVKKTKWSKFNDGTAIAKNYDFFSFVTNGILREIFSYFVVDLPTLVALRSTCRTFHEIIQQYFWMQRVSIEKLNLLFNHKTPNLTLPRFISVHIPDQKHWISDYSNLYILKNPIFQKIRIVGVVDFTKLFNYLPSTLKILYLGDSLYWDELIEFFKSPIHNMKDDFFDKMIKNIMINIKIPGDLYKTFDIFSFFITIIMKSKNGSSSERLFKVITEVFENLLKHGHSINYQTCYSLSTPLHNFIQYTIPFAQVNDQDNLFIVKTFVENGAKINIANKYKSTPLHEACEKINLEIIKYLVNLHSININEQDIFGNTPLLLFCKNATLFPPTSQNVLEYLLRNGADPNIQNINGMTPLHYLVKGTLEMVQTIHSHGAVLNLKNKSNLTPLQYFHTQFKTPFSQQQDLILNYFNENDTQQ